ncbi:hypothetical protein L1049_011006 [Liquidambar formosana]|uniref:PGG domain-containing protein n=1 Tax=Liquidambar formosana TaxID=63359 RepID=A0AAP0RWI2_LIQFO
MLSSEIDIIYEIIVEYMTDGNEEAEIKKTLVRCASTSKWEEVVQILEEKPWSLALGINRSGDTALHMAVLDGQEDIVRRLMELVVKEGMSLSSMRNQRGNTPLHLAASVGTVKMCESIGAKDSKLMEGRNQDGETPFFLAALHGKKDTFLYLHSLCHGLEGYSYCRRSDGDTILHSAIAGDYFDLAFQIACLYQGLVVCRNERGLYPLHLLASKPYAFESGSSHRWLNRIIYRGISVDELKTPTDLPPEAVENGQNHEGHESDQTSSNFFHLLGKFVHGGNQSSLGHGRLPSNSYMRFGFVKRALKALLAALSGICEELDSEKPCMIVTSNWEYSRGGRNPRQSQDPQQSPSTGDPFFDESETRESHEILDQGILGGDHFKIVGNQRDNKPGGAVYGYDIGKGETPILVASKMGVEEMVEKILEHTPVALSDVNSDGKNLVHLAAENRQLTVYRFLLEDIYLGESVFRQADHQGNSALHLAATLRGPPPWHIQGPALQMQWEIKWFQFVKDSVHPNFFTRYNKDGKTAEDVFAETHENLVKEGSAWLTKTSKSCSVVATLIAPVAFATSASIPSNLKQDSNSATLTYQEELAFISFAISSLIALFFSVISLILFLSILTSRHQGEDFRSRLPGKFLMALTSLLISIISMLVSFSSSHFFVLKQNLKLEAYPLYAVLCAAVTLTVMFHFPLYLDF